MKRRSSICFGIFFIVMLLFFCNLFYGSVAIPVSTVFHILLGQNVESEVWTMIVLQSRMPQAITALLSGAALAVSGLMLQTLFQNPLAGPSILGISNGANLGVALVMLCSGGIFSAAEGFLNVSIVLAAFLGSLAILMLILYFSSKLRSNILVLIIGMMIGYLTSSLISILNTYASADNIRAFVMWGMGSFSGVSLVQLPFLCIFLTVGLIVSILLIKPLNTLLLGEKYASNLGINIKRIRILILLTTGLLIAVVTAFCGPISFIGLAVPHIARMLLKTSNQQLLLPATILSGSVVALICNLLTILPFGKGLLPLNAVTSLFGAPVIIYILLNRKNMHYFN